MNSIAYMPAPTSREANAIAAAMVEQGLSNAAVAHHMGVSDGLVSQWKTGHRPVPAQHAPRLARMLNVADPSAISAQYAEVYSSQTGNAVALPVTIEGRDDLSVPRLENAVDDLRYALAAITSAMILHRPAEARDVAKAIRKHVAAKRVRTGFLAELLRALDEAR